MEGCIEACASWNVPENVTCLAAQYGWASNVGLYCYFYHAIGPVVQQGGSEFGVMVSFEP